MIAHPCDMLRSPSLKTPSQSLPGITRIDLMFVYSDLNSLLSLSVKHGCRELVAILTITMYRYVAV